MNNPVCSGSVQALMLLDFVLLLEVGFGVSFCCISHQLIPTEDYDTLNSTSSIFCTYFDIKKF